MIKKKLPRSTYKKLKAWHDNFGSIDSYDNDPDHLYKQIHDNIATNKDNQLHERERDILDTLLSDSAMIVTRDNLWEYLINFDDIITDKILEEKIYAELSLLLSQGKFEEAEKFLKKNEKYSDSKKCLKARKKYLNYYLSEQLEQSSNIDDFIKISEKYKSDLQVLNLQDVFYTKIESRMMSDYEKLLKEYNFEEANIFFQKYKKYLDEEKSAEVWNYYIKLEMQNVYEKLLKQFKFEKADKFLETNKNEISQIEYEGIKAKYIQDYFTKELNVEFPPDSEQSEAIGAIGDNVLVDARAGSGKTQTIAGKVVFLCEKYNVSPDDILVLTFNKDAALSIKQRIGKFVPKFQNAKTFHGLAYDIVKPSKGDILFDNGGEFARKEQSDFVKNIIENIVRNNFEINKMIYGFFRSEKFTIDENKSETISFANEDERYLYLRNKTEITLSGTHVKSRGEKWIADFLFEHDINFSYEKQFNWEDIDNKKYHPDFTLMIKKQIYILEHWGIDEFSNEKKVPDFWTKTYGEYKEEMNKKRELFKTSDEILLETSIRDIDYDINDIKLQRKKFEQKLKKMLESRGITCNKLSENTLIDSAIKKNLFTQFNDLMINFIGWMEKKEWSSDDLEGIVKNSKLNEQQVIFCRIGYIIYEEYLNKLGDRIDFNMLISQAKDSILTGEYSIVNIKYILIDEFQDFSQLFQNLIEAIRSRNENIKLFCVGDPWQMINGFIGSDLEIFDNFKQNANAKAISTCYRSDRKIVEIGNRFARLYEGSFLGEYSKAYSNDDGQIIKEFIDDVRIANTNIENEDAKYKQFFKKSEKGGLNPGDIWKAEHLKKINQIIDENSNKSFLFLYKENKIKKIYISEIKKYITTILKQDENRVPEDMEFKTMHSSKGLEKDVVVLVDVCERIIPKIHPTNELFEVFGRTPEKILNEEKRLFYVAMTRAKEKLYILTEKGKESEFLKGLQIKSEK